jgi:ribosomal-protein-alanine N-acetyltransferase
VNAEPSGLEPIVIQTERLILRRLTMDDLEAPAALYGDPEVRRYFPDGTRTYEQTREELEWVIDVYYGQYGYGLWGRRSSGRPAPSSAAAGCCPGRSRAGTEVEVAYLLNRNYWAAVWPPRRRERSWTTPSRRSWPSV